MSTLAGPGLVRLQSQPTAVQNLGEALRALWRQAGAELGVAEVGRSLVVNFLGVAPTPDHTRQLREATERLARRSPCRAFLLHFDDRSREPTAAVAATVRASGDARDIVLEELNVQLPPHWAPHLPGLIRPLLMNDLPNHLFWSGPLHHNLQTFDALLELCDHAVVDSQHFAVPALDLDAVRARQATARPITDLSWLRLRPWRRSLAEVFQRVPWHADPNAHCTIRHTQRSASSAILLGHWLEQRLGVRCSLEETSRHDSPCPESLDLHSKDHDIRLTNRGTQVSVQVTTEVECLLPFGVASSRGTPGDLLAAAIDGTAGLRGFSARGM